LCFNFFNIRLYVVYEDDLNKQWTESRWAFEGMTEFSIQLSAESKRMIIRRNSRFYASVRKLLSRLNPTSFQQLSKTCMQLGTVRLRRQ
jgi:hypothetical protein